MSLLKQLLLSVTIAIVGILVGTLIFSIGGAQQYLNNQVQAQSENAATSLALTLSQPQNQDEVTRELLIAALFDSGQFRSIRLQGTDGSVLFERNMPPSAAGDAPDWFNTWVPLSAPMAVRQVTDGWKQVGRLSVTADDLSARTALWNGAVGVFVLVVGAGLLWAMFAALLIRWLKRALRLEITEQVRAIGEGDNPIQQRKSRIAELNQAARTIRDVRERVRATAQEQDARIESLQLELNSDAVTGLANRKYFLNELRRALQRGEANSGVAGHVLIFRQRDLSAVNTAMSRADADQWLRLVGQNLLRTIDGFDTPPEYKPQLARLNGSDFVVLMPGFNGPDASRLVQQLRQELNVMRVPIGDDRLCRWSLALTDYAGDCDVSAILGRLDQGLMKAESTGRDDVEYVYYFDECSGSAPGAAGEMVWRELLDDALQQNKLELAVQPATYEGDSVHERHEASLALRDEKNDGKLLSGYLFMPAAVRLGLCADCDLRAVDLALEWLDTNSGALMIRVSLPSLLQPQFLPELQQRLRTPTAAPQVVGRLELEIDAHGLVAYADEVEAFCKAVVDAGARVGLRRLAAQPAALLQLHQAPLSYVKLSGDLVADIPSSPGAMQLMQAVNTTANTLGMKVYADDVPNAAAAALLRASGALLPDSSIWTDARVGA